MAWHSHSLLYTLGMPGLLLLRGDWRLRSCVRTPGSLACSALACACHHRCSHMRAKDLQALQSRLRGLLLLRKPSLS